MSNSAAALKHRHVWIFREARTGGTVCSGVIAYHMKRHHTFIKSSIDEVYPARGSINTTHNFELLPSVVSTFNPILIRCSRKNKVEQLLSKIAMIHYTFGTPNPTYISFLTEANADEVKRFIDSLKNETIEVEKSQVIGFANECLSINRLWKQHSQSVESQIVYYEDMANPIDLPNLGLTQINLLSNPRTKVTKLPEYKKELFSNYDQVEEWMNKYYYEHCT